CCFLFRGVIGHAGIRKAAALHHTVFAAPARRRIGYAISEASTRDRATDAFAAARTISVPITAWQCWRAQPVNIGGLVGITLAWQTVRIAKSTGLHLIDGSIHGGWRRTSA